MQRENGEWLGAPEVGVCPDGRGLGGAVRDSPVSGWVLRTIRDGRARRVPTAASPGLRAGRSPHRQLWVCGPWAVLSASLQVPEIKQAQISFGFKALNPLWNSTGVLSALSLVFLSCKEFQLQGTSLTALLAERGHKKVRRTSREDRFSD